MAVVNAFPNMVVIYAMPPLQYYVSCFCYSTLKLLYPEII